MYAEGTLGAKKKHKGIGSNTVGARSSVFPPLPLS